MSKSEIARADTADIIFNWRNSETLDIQAECVDLETLSHPTRKWSVESIAAIARLAEEAYSVPAPAPARIVDASPVGLNLHVVRRRNNSQK